MKLPEKQLIIAISGKKQAGKSTLCDYISKIYLDYFIDEVVSVFNFADPLKEKICIGVLGLTHAQVHGSEEEKNSLTPYIWDKMPIDIRKNYSKEVKNIPVGTQSSYDSFEDKYDDDYYQALYEEHIIPRTGPMTAREIMQIVGTDIFREMFDDNVWVNAALRSIKESKVPIALVADCRFPSEVNAVLKEGGIVIRLTRELESQDNHSSETALDDYPFDTTDGCFIIDNHDKSIEWKNEHVKSLLSETKTNV
jgi:hypothetical protein